MKPTISPLGEKVQVELLKKKEKEWLVPFLKEEINHPLVKLTSSPFEEKVRAKSKKKEKITVNTILINPTSI
jgi:hypothetical protein